MHLNRKKITQTKFKITPVVKNVNKKNKISKKDIKPIVYFSRGKKVKKVQIEPHLSKKVNSQIKDTFDVLDRWTNVMSGHPAFILGNSPSISSVDLGILDSYFTIGVNRIFYIYDPTILMWQDRQILMTEKNNIQKQKAIKICSSQVDSRHLFLNFKVFNNPYKFSMIPSQLYGRGNTGVLGVELAVALGCSAVVLIGMDCQYGAHGKTDFYGKNKDHKPYTLKMCKEAIQFVKDSCPIPVYNCGESDYWKRYSLEEIVNILNPKKMGREHFKSLLFL